jgi:Spy/CpxP family protein refolding chaperone
MKWFNTGSKKVSAIAPVILTASLIGSGLMIAPGTYAGDWWGGKDKCAEEGGRHGEKGSKHAGVERFRKMADKLDFTDAQEQQLEQILSSAKAKMEAEGERGAMRQKLMSIDPEDSNYDKEVAAAADQAATKVKAKILAMADVRKQVHAILTDEQKEKLEKMMEKRQEKMKKRAD